MDMKKDSPVINHHQLKLLFEKSQRHLNHFFDNLNLASVQVLAQTLISAPRNVCFTGICRSGVVAEKLSQTLALSLRLNRFSYLSPSELYSELCTLFPSDILVIISKFGSSDTLLNLVPYAKAKGARVISITSVEDNPLSTLCDIDIHLPVPEPLEKESWPLDVVPSISSSVQMFFGDLVVAAIIEAKKLTEENHARNHPAA